MPLYEYECQKCSHRFEKIEPVSAAAVKKCPKCGGKCERLLAPPAIHFKGSGWYVTDYAGRGAAKAESEEKGASTEKKEGKEAKEVKETKEKPKKEHKHK